MQANHISPVGLINDNFIGYLDAWIYQNDITWMEKTVASPFWTGMTLFSIDRRFTERRHKHNLLDNIYETRGRVMFKGQLFSAPMNWDAMLEQLKNMEDQEPYISLPVQGAVLAARVRISIASGLVDLNRLLRQATVRRNVVVQLIRMRRDSGHPDYKTVDMRSVERSSQQLAPTNEPAIPSGLAEFLEGNDGLWGEEFSGVDKAATPAERLHNEVDVRRDMERKRPQALVAQRDSDANRNVPISRESALSEFSTLSLRTGSNLERQFHSSYLSRVFCTTLPWCVGGPDFPRQQRWRRCYDDAPMVSLDTYTSMMAARCEYQIRADWDFNPGVFSLAFASKVNLCQSMGIQRALRRGGGEKGQNAKSGASLVDLYEKLWCGEYLDAAGRRLPVRGDLSKVHQIIGLTSTEKAMLKNFHFMSGRLAGTRQVRNSIRHIVFSSRIFYGTPVFFTLTPSERHSGLAIRLFRGRRNDPAFTGAAQDIKAWIGLNTPSLCPPDEVDRDGEAAVTDLPEYDTRRKITSCDPLCCVHAFQVMTRVVLPSLFGFRMCPQCPHCATGENPCMDSFGSSATPTGGSAGRCDAFVGAVESQKTEALHVHGFFYLQMPMQFLPLHELAQMLRDEMISSNAIKHYTSYSRCAEYPDLEAHKKKCEDIEKAWPAFANDDTLARLPSFFWSLPPASGAEWHRSYVLRLQHILEHMQHHIHPKNPATGERRSLQSCRPKV